MAGQGQQWAQGAFVAGPQTGVGDPSGLRIQLVAPTDSVSMSNICTVSQTSALQPCMYPMVLTSVESQNTSPSSASIAVAPTVISLNLPGTFTKTEDSTDAGRSGGVVEKVANGSAGDVVGGVRPVGSLSELPASVKLQVMEAMGVQGLISLGTGEAGAAEIGRVKDAGGKARTAEGMLEQRVSIGLVSNGTEEHCRPTPTDRPPLSSEDRPTSAKERNRLAQQRFRERQKQRIAGLQEKVAELTRHVRFLQEELEHLRKEREALLAELKNRGVVWPVQ